PAAISPQHFPAKLWGLVNNPRCRSVQWDDSGKGLLIYQPLFDREVLGTEPEQPEGPGSEELAGAANVFHTKRFRSILRQLNLYGFHVMGKALEVKSESGSSSTVHRFQSPFFCRDHPDLLIYLRPQKGNKRINPFAGLQIPSNIQE
ncbi:HSF5 protein, partial [Urocolius indicus]|nr:HSF5 protein [Urocolius indicus]